MRRKRTATVASPEKAPTTRRTSRRGRKSPSKSPEPDPEEQTSEVTNTENSDRDSSSDRIGKTPSKRRASARKSIRGRTADDKEPRSSRGRRRKIIQEESEPDADDTEVEIVPIVVLDEADDDIQDAQSKTSDAQESEKPQTALVEPAVKVIAQETIAAASQQIIVEESASSEPVATATVQLTTDSSEVIELDQDEQSDQPEPMEQDQESPKEAETERPCSVSSESQEVAESVSKEVPTAVAKEPSPEPTQPDTAEQSNDNTPEKSPENIIEIPDEETAEEPESVQIPEPAVPSPVPIVEKEKPIARITPIESPKKMSPHDASPKERNLRVSPVKEPKERNLRVSPVKEPKERNLRVSPVKEPKSPKKTEVSSVTAAAAAAVVAVPVVTAQVTEKPPRKRRWISRTGSSNAKPVLAISTDSLKNIISDVKPVPLSDLKLDSSMEGGEMSEPEEEEEVNENLPRFKEKSKKESTEAPPVTEHSTTTATRKAMQTSGGSTANANTNANSNANANAESQRPPSPPKHSSSNILYITNLVRPFTVLQLKGLLARTGKIVENGFWIDKIKSKCFVKYTTEDEAIETRHALHGVRWPTSNPKCLNVDFGSDDAMEKAFETTINEMPKVGMVRDDRGGLAWEREKIEMDRNKDLQVTRPVREWDVGKKEGLAREQEAERDRPGRKRSADREFGRERKRSRSESPSRKFKKKDNDPPLRLLDDLFRKTNTTPSVYWLPLTAEQIAVKEEMRRKHMAEHQRRMEEIKKQEKERERERDRDKDRERNRSDERRRDRSRSRDRDRRRY